MAEAANAIIKCFISLFPKGDARTTRAGVGLFSGCAVCEVKAICRWRDTTSRSAPSHRRCRYRQNCHRGCCGQKTWSGWIEVVASYLLSYSEDKMDGAAVESEAAEIDIESSRRN